MDEKIQVGDVIKMKKQHPCGTNQWEVIRVGMDFRLKCEGCGRQVMVPRKLVEKNFRGFIKRAEEKYRIGLQNILPYDNILNCDM